jgi:hypothetical protein
VPKTAISGYFFGDIHCEALVAVEWYHLTTPPPFTHLVNEARASQGLERVYSPQRPVDVLAGTSLAATFNSLFGN